MSNVDINVDRRTDGQTDGRKTGRLYRTLLQAGAIKTTQVFWGQVFFSVTETDETIKIYKESSKMD